MLRRRATVSNRVRSIFGPGRRSALGASAAELIRRAEGQLRVEPVHPITIRWTAVIQHETVASGFGRSRHSPGLASLTLPPRQPQTDGPQRESPASGWRRFCYLNVAWLALSLQTSACKFQGIKK